MKKVVVVLVLLFAFVAIIAFLYDPIPQWFNGKYAEVQYLRELNEPLKSELETAVPRGSFSNGVNTGMYISYSSTFRKETNQYIYLFKNHGKVDVLIKSELIKVLTGKNKLTVLAGQCAVLSIYHSVSPKEIETDFGFRYAEVGVLVYVETDNGYLAKDTMGTTAFFVLPKDIVK